MVVCKGSSAFVRPNYYRIFEVQYILTVRNKLFLYSQSLPFNQEIAADVLLLLPDVLLKSAL